MISIFNDFRTSKRVYSVDLLKLFASLLVILSHCYNKYVNNFETPFSNYIWLTQMPLFMAASGLVFADRTKFTTIKDYLYRELRNVVTLLIPCFTFLVISTIISQKNILNSFVEFYLNPETNLWFLWVLFLVHVIFDFGLYLSNKISNRYLRFALPYVISAFISVTIFVLILVFKDGFDSNILCVRLLAFYLPFYCLGTLIRELLTRINFETKLNKILLICISAVSLAVLLFEIIYFKSIYAFDDSNIKYMLIRVIGSVSSIIVHIVLFDLICNLAFFRRISKYGAYSLESYYLHILWIRLFTYSSTDIATQYLQFFGTFVFLVLLVILTLVITYFVPYLHLVLFGRSKSMYAFEKRLPKLFR